jgi:CHAT domain-containing protein
MNNLGLVYRYLGDFQRSIDYYERALVLRRQVGDRRGEAITIANIGSVYRSLGEPARTLELLNEALAIYKEGGFKRNEARTLSSIGAVYTILDENEKALETYRRALEIEKSIDNKQGQASGLRNIANIYADAGKPHEALPLIEESIRLSKAAEDKEEIADEMLSLARIYDRLNRIDEAAAAYDEAIRLNRETEMPIDIAEALYHSARFDERRERLESAVKKMVEVLDTVEDVRNTIVAPTLRSTFLADQQKYFDFYLSLMVSRHRREPNRAYDAVAFRISERARARSLLESLGEAQKEIRSGTPPALIEREALLRQTIGAKETQRLNAVRQNKRAASGEYERELAQLVRSYRELQTEIRKQNPQLAALIKPEPLELHQVQAEVIDANSVLLEYFLGTERSFLFIVTQNTIEIVDLPKQEIVEKAARSALESVRARGVVHQNETPESRQTRIDSRDRVTDNELAELYSMLIAPAAEKIKNKRLLIVGSDILQYFPFGMLKTKSSSGKASYLIATNEIVNLPSASVVPHLRQNRSPRPEYKNLISVVADPVFSNDDSRMKIIATTDASATTAVSRKVKYLLPALRSDFSRLRFSRLEAEAISELAPNDRRMVALDFAANISSATGPDVQRSKIVHFATHGVINSQFPELSGLVFSMVDEKGQPQNGILRLADIYNMRLHSDLVVLSACETALGKQIKGEGIVGLTRGVMYAGAPSVLASFWRVEDRATADLMKRFYSGVLKDAAPPAAALRSAQNTMLKEKGTSHPFYWAGFSLHGDWQNRK